MAELTARADAIFREQGMTGGTVAERLRALGEDKRFIYPNTDAGKTELIAKLNEQIEEMQRRLPEMFGRLPKAKVEIRRVPAEIEDGAAGGYYQIPALDGSRPGAYYINLRDTAENPSWTLPTLTYHEATPGHHHQIALAQEATGIPRLRRLPVYSVYTEGWGLYAEQLADEMGVYDGDLFGRLGYLQSYMFRAARLVIDTGLHHYRWSREKAISYMNEALGTPEPSNVTEVERYCVWPGQATSYMVGQTRWVATRERARAALGDKFDIRAFHDTALAAGAMPIDVLGSMIDALGGGDKRPEEPHGLSRSCLSVRDLRPVGIRGLACCHILRHAELVSASMAGPLPLRRLSGEGGPWTPIGSGAGSETSRHIYHSDKSGAVPRRKPGSR